MVEPKIIYNGTPKQVQITDALLREAKRQGYNHLSLARKMRGPGGTLYMLKDHKNIGIHNFIDIAEALDVEIALKGEILLRE